MRKTLPEYVVAYPQSPELSRDYDCNAVGDILRTETTCRGCGKPKDYGLVVCWGCFKFTHTEPLKYYGGTTREWLTKYEVPTCI